MENSIGSVVSEILTDTPKNLTTLCNRIHVTAQWFMRGGLKLMVAREKTSTEDVFKSAKLFYN